jgi:hypothetical protein
MRQTIELLRKQSIQAGLTSAHMQSMGVQVNGNGTSKTNGSPTKSNGHEQENHQPQQQQQQQQNGNMQRQHSTDSMCSVNSNGSNGSSSQDKNKKKKGWVCTKNLYDSIFYKKTFFLCSSEVPSRKLFHAMPKSPKHIAKQIFYPQIIPTRNLLYLPHRRSILRQSRVSHQHRPPNRVHIVTFQLSKMPNPLTR